MISYHNKKFRATINSAGGNVTDETIFYYTQDGNIVTATYSGGEIICGHLMALADQNGNLKMRNHHVNVSGNLMTGECSSTPEILVNGKIRLHEKWQWTSGDMSSGESIVEEF